METSKKGIGRNWKRIYGVYRSIPKVYDRTNRFISFFQDIRLRKEVLDIVAQNTKSNSRILDAGAGTGIMSKLYKSMKNADITMLDYSAEMLENSGMKCEMVQGSFDRMPFREGAFDSVIMGFSFHASRDMYRSASEINRICKRCLGIVGFGKPSGIFDKLLVSAYLNFLLPVMAFISTPRHYKDFLIIKKIYSELPENEASKSILEKYFKTLFFGQKIRGFTFQFVGLKG